MTIPNLIIGKTNYRNISKVFGIKQADRYSHIYVIGQTGSGKTTLLLNLMANDLANGQGFAFLDPHGDAVDSLYFSLSEEKKSRVIYFNVPDNKELLGYNPFRQLKVSQRPLAASGIMEVFKKLWDRQSWGVRMEHILRNCLLVLYDQPKATLADVLRLLNDKKFREKAVKNVSNKVVKEFWLNEFERYSYRYRADSIAPIQNKVGAFLANPIINQILTEPKENLSLRRIMDEKKVLLVNLSKGKLGEDASRLLGGLLMTSLGLAAYSRASIPEIERRGFTIYADEFQNFTTLSLVNMASELRKYRVALLLAHQYLHQLDKEILEAVLGNAGTVICFRVGPTDAVYLEKEFLPTFNRYDLMNLSNHEIYLKLMIDGKPSRPFSAVTLPPFY